MRDPIAVVLSAIIVAAYGAWTVFVVSTDRPLDYYTYVIAAEVLVRGENIFAMPEAGYAVVARELGVTNFAPPYRYPLLSALVVLPLRYLPLRLGATAWVFASGLAALCAAWLIASAAAQAWQRRIILLAALGFVPIYTTLNAGQVNTFPLLCTAAALRVWAQGNQGQAGAWLTVGLWFKPFVFALPALAVWRLQWRFLVGALAASFAIIALCLPVFGIPLNIAQLEIFSGYQGIAAMPIPTNQNLTGLLSRWLTPNDYGTPLINAPELLTPVRFAVSALVGLLLLRLLWPAGSRSGSRIQLEASFLIVATHLLFTQTWYHHLAMLFIPVAVLVTTWESWRLPSVRSGAWLVAIVLIGVHGLLWKQLSGQTLLLDGATWAQIILLWLVADGLRRAAQTEPA